MAFRKKYKNIINLKPDILIIPECENIQLYDELTSMENLTDSYWIGDNKSKGLGIFAFNGCKMTLFENYNNIFKYIVPFKIFFDNGNFNLYAVWTMNDKDNFYKRYIAQLGLALEYYSCQLDENTIICGDFNSNKIWDAEKSVRAVTYSSVVDFLRIRGINSMYHQYFNELHGDESKGTFYMYKKFEKPYHIDYCFASQVFSENLETIEIGQFEDWKSLSDHVPLVFDFSSCQ